MWILKNVLKNSFSIKLYRTAFTYTLKMDKAYLRYLNEDKFSLCFYCKHDEFRINRQFNFSRQLSEPINTFLSRVNTNVEKQVNKKRKRKKNAEELQQIEVKSFLTRNAEVVQNDIPCKDVFVHENIIELHLLNMVYSVIVNSPFVDSLSLPKSLMSGFAVYPNEFESVFTDIRLSDYSWYASQDKLNWRLIGSGFLYTPTNLEIGSYLKLVCVPKNQNHEGPVAETISNETVSAGPGVCPFEIRHKFTMNKCSKNE